MQFYPETPIISIPPSQSSGELRYILYCSQDSISKKDITIKYAFTGKWKHHSQELKSRVREILIQILDISHLSIQSQEDFFILSVPLKPISSFSPLPEHPLPLDVPIVIKILKKETSSGEAFHLKCYQTLRFLESEQDLSLLENQENYISLPHLAAIQPEENHEQTIVLNENSVLSWQNLLNSLKNRELAQQKKQSLQSESLEEKQALEKESLKLYSGIMAIDFGTTNSVVVVRDPLYAAEEIKNNLTHEQWNSLFQWFDAWLIKHLSTSQKNTEDLYIEELIQTVFDEYMPTSGSFSVDLWEKLQKITKDSKVQFLQNALKNFAASDPDEKNWDCISNIILEITKGFKQSIYSNILTSQRYFILELDSNAGSGPISSALQIVSAPATADQDKLELETIIEMGIRVHLLMRSAALREADINQFALSMKRYFGQEKTISLFPSESDAAPVSFLPDVLCRLTYKKLIERALDDIKKRSKKQQLQYADKINTLVVTFPTTYPASLRRRLREMIHDLEIQSIDTRFDEGTASAIYYIWHTICANPVCGINGLMARCRKDRHGRSYQNILLYDLGGGTTDIALLQLIYEELPIFEPLDKTKAEGCYYRITPRLLGATGHRYIGGDLLTLWLFRLVKTKLADRILTLIANEELEPPGGSPLDNLMNRLPDEFLGKDGKYQSGSLLGWTYAPAQNIRKFEELNHSIINVVVPTIFETDSTCTPNFFTLWDLTEECKKRLGTPVATFSGSGLGREWLESAVVEQSPLWRIVVLTYPWVVESTLSSDDLKITITQEELCKFSEKVILESLSPAIHLAQARLRCHNFVDKLDRLILSGLSCNLKIVQHIARDMFFKSEGLFDFNLANVVFDPALAKTSVAMGACIGRYLQSIRLDPLHEKTRQMLREGYDQVELVVENLFTHLACRLVYDSLVAMVEIFDHGQELNRKSFVDGKPVARTPMHDLRPVQEKFWIYRLDFEGATPQYLGLINSEAVFQKSGINDFRKFREQYLVGFETDAELFTRAFFVPRGPKNILAIDFLEDHSYKLPACNIVEEDEYGYVIIRKNISNQELFNRRNILLEGTRMIDTIEYPDGTKQRCVLSEPLPIREMYDFYIENLENTSNKEPALISHFYLSNENVEEVSLACDETGRILLLLSTVYDIKIWADIDYVPQKVDSQFDPFCGQH
ncbi:MAG TPA: hypothetical protein P5543_01345 [Planctomycetota bacterium]|nr:hypothetical protein [Planctomycetota bacterium]